MATKKRHLTTSGISKAETTINKVHSAQVRDTARGFNAGANALTKERNGMLSLAAELGASCRLDTSGKKDKWICASSTKLLMARLERRRVRVYAQKRNR